MKFMSVIEYGIQIDDPYTKMDRTKEVFEVFYGIRFEFRLHHPKQ